jgi:hypothetical protein
MVRSGQGNVKCNTIEADYNRNDAATMGTAFGGNAGAGVLGCPVGKT